MCCHVLVKLKYLTSLTGQRLWPGALGTNCARCQHDVALLALSDELELVRQRHSAGLAWPVRHLRPGALVAT